MYQLEEFVKNTWNTEEFNVILTIPVLWSGWEMDNKAVVIVVHKEVGGGVFCVGSTHGYPEIMPIEELNDKVKEYSDVLSKTLQAIDLLNNQ